MPCSLGVARLLLVVGSLSLGSLALAGPPTCCPDGRCPCQATSVGSDQRFVLGAMHVGNDQARFEAMKVELALLGDPHTYALPLEVSLGADTVELRGKVGDQATRRHVLEVARQSCYLPIQDNLTIGTALTDGWSTTPVALQKEARDLLVRKLGSPAGRLQITADASGQIVLRGEVASLEEKLTASRCLRGLEGCTRVVNSLSVRMARQAGHQITLVSGEEEPGAPRRSIRQVADVEEVPSPVPHVSRVPASSSSNLPTLRHVTVHTGPQNARPVMYVAPNSGYATQPSAGYPGCACGNTGIQLNSAQSGQRPSLWERLFTKKTTRHPHPTLPHGTYHKSPTTSYPPGYAPTTDAPPLVAPVAPMSVPHLTEPPLAPPAPPVGQPHSSRRSTEGHLIPTSNYAYAPAATTVPAQPAVWPPAHDVRPVTAQPASTVYRSRPLAGLLKRQPQQVPTPAQQAAAQQAAAQQAAAQYASAQYAAAQRAAGQTNAYPVAHQPTPTVTPGLQPAPTAPVQPIHAAQPVSRRTAKPTSPEGNGGEATSVPPRELVHRVRLACGKLAQDVKAEVNPDRSISVHVYAGPGTEQLIVARLLQVQELAASNVRLHVHLAQ